MGYERKSLQILGGSWNPLPSRDKTPETDYLLAQNWRVDKVGKLVSRFGYPQKWSINSAGVAHSAGQHGGVQGDYYVACNWATGPINSVYVNPTPTSSPLALGFDGNRVGFAAMNGYVYVMNRGKQGRHKSGGSFESWNISPPTSSATAASSGSSPSVIGSTTFSYTLQGNPDYLHYLTVNGTTYSFKENGYGASQLPLLISLLAKDDPSVTVTYSGSGSSVTITPIPVNTLVNVSGSDGNGSAALGTGTISTLPNGTYTYYVTFESSDKSMESNPGPVSNAVTISSHAVALTGIPTSSDSRVGARNIYAAGGLLGQAYLVGTIPDNTTTTYTVAIGDLDITNNGVVMPANNDGPPAASGVLGPYFSRLYAWSTAAHPNRLFYSAIGQPQYFPGSASDEEGNWVDVGAEGEAIMWCTAHTNVLVIYKERSTWILIGDPESDTSTLEQVHDSIGISGAFCVVNAGQYDYLISSQGLHKFNLSSFEDATGVIRPLFNGSNSNSGPLTPVGAIAPGANYLSNSLFSYAAALGYGMGKLYIGFTENSSPTSYCLAIFDETTGRWFYNRNGISGVTQFAGFYFDGVVMAGLTGSPTGNAYAFNLDDFRTYAVADVGGTPIRCIYQSHFEDAGLPDNDKVWLEVVVDYELSGDSADLYVAYNNATSLGGYVGSFTGSQRNSQGFRLGNADDGIEARNISIGIDCSASNGPVIIYNIHLYYYPEARRAYSAASIPTDLGSAKVKQVKELELDIDPSEGNVQVNLSSDLPGNALALRQTPTVPQSFGRRVMKFPFPVTEGFLWKLALRAAGAFGPFRLYGARLLTRAMGTYVEAYEAANGFQWDSGEQTFDSGITHIPRGYAIALASLPIKRAREIRLEIDIQGSGFVSVALWSDLPGNFQQSRFSTGFSATAGRRFINIPLPSGFSAPIEGRMFRLVLSATTKFILYSAAIEILPVGVYVEAYEAAGGAVYDSREVDFGTPQVKEVRELELDIETDTPAATVNVTVASDVSGNLSTGVVTTGRQKITLPLVLGEAAESFVEGRLLRLLLSGTNGFRLYGARFKMRPFGQYMLATGTSTDVFWDTTDLDLGTQTVKQLREIELDLAAVGAYTLTLYTDLPGNSMAARATFTQAATVGRTKVQIPLNQGGVPDNYIYGRLARLTLKSSANVKLFGARINARPVGVYVEPYEAAAGAVWDSQPFDCGSPNVKTFDELRIEMDSDSTVQVAVYTDLPGEDYTLRKTFTVTSGASNRHWATVPLFVSTFGDIYGRAIRVVVSSSAGFRIYGAQVRSSRIGRYLAAASPAGNDSFAALEFDFQSERVKQFKKIEIDCDGAAFILSVLTNQGGPLASIDTIPIGTSGRRTMTLPLPNGSRGRLLRLVATGTVPARIYHLRVWARPLNEPNAPWAWVDYPLEESDQLPAWTPIPVPETPAQFAWSDLPVAATPVEWVWAPLPVAPTEPQWFWAKVLSVEETSDVWTWVDIDMSVQ